MCVCVCGGGGGGGGGICMCVFPRRESCRCEQNVWYTPMLVSDEVVLLYSGSAIKTLFLLLVSRAAWLSV